MSPKKSSKNDKNRNKPREAVAEPSTYDPKKSAQPLRSSAMARGLAQIDRAVLVAASSDKANARAVSNATSNPAGATRSTTANPAAVARSAAANVPTSTVDAASRAAFAMAMTGVKPLAGRGGANVIRARAGGARGAADESAAPGASRRREAAEGGTPLTVRWQADGVVEGVRAGRWFALEAIQRFAVPDAQLDLHGLDVASARGRVAEFVRAQQRRGARVVRIVVGVGRHAPDQDSILRDVTVATLSDPPTATDVDAFCTDVERRGALVVALRTERVQGGRGP